MTDESKTVRLNKIAREFNLGVSTIVEFLGSKGIAVENNANAKVDMPTAREPARTMLRKVFMVI